MKVKNAVLFIDINKFFKNYGTTNTKFNCGYLHIEIYNKNNNNLLCDYVVDSGATN